MARGATVRNVGFAKEITSFRQPRDDELSVMSYFAKHATKCDHCYDPYEAYKQDRHLCSRGRALAKDVATYLYAKGGRPFSMIDRQEGERVQVAIPAEYDVVNQLIKAFGKGMSLDSPRKVIIIPEKRDRVEKLDMVVVQPSLEAPRRSVYPAEERPRQRQYVKDDFDLLEVRPSSSRHDRRERVYHGERVERYERKERPKSVIYPERKGSLFPRDEEEKRRRQRYEQQPIVMIAEPGSRYTVRR